ncbi:hypothetical protein AVEN_246906-1 [Araneus ventricosus]|uniref:Uncharacterized protein n=1 Tax=Araneus ventricosus TaxID=182803 RepID=A0A4Y2PJT3_ARAVE|nr:hypothetical protein AVEN_246906-1 [Araneus ventricosus]
MTSDIGDKPSDHFGDLATDVSPLLIRFCIRVHLAMRAFISKSKVWIKAMIFTFSSVKHYHTEKVLLQKCNTLMVGKRDLRRFSPAMKGDQANDSRRWRRTWRPFWRFGDKYDDFDDKMKGLENTRIFARTLLGRDLRSIFERFICDIISCRKRYKHLWRAKNLFGVLSAVRIGIESAVPVVISELLSVCANSLYNNNIYFLFPVLGVFRNIRE